MAILVASEIGCPRFMNFAVSELVNVFGKETAAQYPLEPTLPRLDLCFELREILLEVGFLIPSDYLPPVELLALVIHELIHTIV